MQGIYKNKDGELREARTDAGRDVARVYSTLRSCAKFAKKQDGTLLKFAMTFCWKLERELRIREYGRMTVQTRN